MPSPGAQAVNLILNTVLKVFEDFAYHRELRRRDVDAPSISHPFYGMSEFRIEDPDGNRLWIGQRTGDQREQHHFVPIDMLGLLT